MDGLKAAFEHRWAWLTLAVSVLAGFLGDVTPVVGGFVEHVRGVVGEIGVLASAAYITLATAWSEK